MSPKLTYHFNFKFSGFLFKWENIYFLFCFVLFVSAFLFSTAIFHPLCNCEQGNETPPFLRNIYYLHAFSNFQQSQFLLEWIRWFPFLMYRLACILICLTPFSDSLWKITSHDSFYIFSQDGRVFSPFPLIICSPSQIVTWRGSDFSKAWTVRF